MARRNVGQYIHFRAWDTSANVGKTGDAANFTLVWDKDGTPAAPTNAPAVEVAGSGGVYRLLLTATETDCENGNISGVSSTSDVSIMEKDIYFEKIADTVWNALTASHVTASTFGLAVGNMLARIGAWTGTGVLRRRFSFCR